MEEKATCPECRCQIWLIYKYRIECAECRLDVNWDTDTKTDEMIDVVNHADD